MNGAKQIISEALSVFIQLGLFVLGVQIGLAIQGYEVALLIGLATAALIIAYNDKQEKKQHEQSATQSGRGTDGGSESENRQNPHADGKAAG